MLFVSWAIDAVARMLEYVPHGGGSLSLLVGVVCVTVGERRLAYGLEKQKWSEERRSLPTGDGGDVVVDEDDGRRLTLADVMRDYGMRGRGRKQKSSLEKS